MKRRGFLVSIILVILVVLSGCSSVNTMVKKRNLDVQTKMSETIWLEPVSPEKKTIYVEIKNTSGESLALQNEIKGLLSQKGYTLVSNPEQAHYWLQANVLKLDKTNLRDSDPFAAGMLGAGIGATLGAYNTGSANTALGLGLAGAIIGGAIDALVSDIVYTMVTDILISEKTNNVVQRSQVNHIQQGTSGKLNTRSKDTTQRNKYQTRVVSVANKSNLSFEEAKPLLEQKLQEVIAGIF